MIILEEKINKEELQRLANHIFGEMIKGVVDVQKEWIALDAELHSDLEAFLLESGSEQENLWGINLYPELEDADFIEFDSLINIRPRQQNKSRGVEDEKVREKIRKIVEKYVA